MSTEQRWLLPEGIDELMPAQAGQLESLRRLVVDCLSSWGYELVVPPLVEYLDSLLTGAGETLDLQTFKLTDQMSGRLLGVRADMTPQVARIAAHRLKTDDVLRLCYIGSILHTKPNGLGGSRNPIQLGAEIYGHAGPESDMEILQLMMAVLDKCNLAESVFIDLGHVGIYRGLAEQAGLDAAQEQALFSALQRKSLPDITALLEQYELSVSSRTMLLALAELNGDVTVLDKAAEILVDAPKSVQDALAQCREMATMMAIRLPNVPVHIDLAELRGYHYHTGLVFAAYRSGMSQTIAVGGRYDDIGGVFGHAQPATGFSLDLKNVVSFARDTTSHAVISTTWSNEPDQLAVIAELRAAGESVRYQLPNATDKATRQLLKQDGRWVVVGE